MSMPLQVTFRGIEHTPSLDAYVQHRAEKLSTYYERITSCRVALERPHRHGKSGNPYRVRIGLSVPGEELVVSRAAGDDPATEDAYASIDRAFDEAARRLQVHVGRVRRRLEPTARCGGALRVRSIARGMSERELVELLEWALPRLGLRSAGFSNVRRQVVRRVAGRIRALGLDVAGYRKLLATNADEWSALGPLCRVTISRYYRDRRVFDALRERLVPMLAERADARGDTTFRVWSAGCASGEEPFTFAILWHLAIAPLHPRLRLDVLATDIDEEVLARAERGCVRSSSLVELPVAWRDEAFEARGDVSCVRERFRRDVRFRREDVRAPKEHGPHDLVLCRNLVFTYFDESAQRAFAASVAAMLVPGGLLVVGKGESVPGDDLAPVRDEPLVWQARYDAGRPIGTT